MFTWLQVVAVMGTSFIFDEWIYILACILCFICMSPLSYIWMVHLRVLFHCIMSHFNFVFTVLTTCQSDWNKNTRVMAGFIGRRRWAASRMSTMADCVLQQEMLKAEYHVMLITATVRVKTFQHRLSWTPANWSHCHVSSWVEFSQCRMQ